MYNIVICDDNEIFCFQLEDILNRIFKGRPTPPRITMFNEAEKLEEYIANDMSIDLLFLDIEFHSESLNGVNIAQFLREQSEGQATQVVFVSSKSEYAMQLFQVRPLDFIIKPIDFDKILHVVKTYERLYATTNKYFSFTFNKVKHFADCRKIVYFQSSGRNVRIATTHGNLLCYDKLSKIIKELPPNLFVQLHKSYIVNISFIVEYSANEVVMSDGVHIPISYSRKEEVHNFLRLNY